MMVGAMTVRVLLFARARDLAGTDTLTLETPAGLTLRQLREELARRFPALADFLPRCQLAIHDTLADDCALVPEEATVAVLPPVSGGTI